jgi:hypothetical protein
MLLDSCRFYFFLTASVRCYLRDPAPLVQNVRFSLLKQVPHINSFNNNAMSLRLLKRHGTAGSMVTVRGGSFLWTTAFGKIFFVTSHLNVRNQAHLWVPFSVLTEFQDADFVTVKVVRCTQHLPQRLNYCKFIVELSTLTHAHRIKHEA